MTVSRSVQPNGGREGALRTLSTRMLNFGSARRVPPRDGRKRIAVLM